MTVYCTDTALILQSSGSGDFIDVLDSWLLSLDTRWLWELSCSHSLCETHPYFFVSVLPLLWTTCFGKQCYEALSI